MGAAAVAVVDEAGGGHPEGLCVSHCVSAAHSRLDSLGARTLRCAQPTPTVRGGEGKTQERGEKRATYAVEVVARVLAVEVTGAVCAEQTGSIFIIAFTRGGLT